MKKQGELLFPGEEVGVIEEFTAGEGTYELDGKVYVSVTGRAFYDMINRKVNSISFKKPSLLALKKSKYVIGVVVGLKEDSALVNILSIEEKPLGSPLTGYVHISQITNKFLEKITDALRIGDIIKAKPINFSIPIALTLKQKDLGVVYAKCPICGTKMVRHDEEHLRCPNCGNIASKKLAIQVKKGGS